MIVWVQLLFVVRITVQDHRNHRSRPRWQLRRAVLVLHKLTWKSKPQCMTEVAQVIRQHTEFLNHTCLLLTRVWWFSLQAVELTQATSCLRAVCMLFTALSARHWGVFHYHCTACPQGKFSFSLTVRHIYLLVSLTPFHLRRRSYYRRWNAHYKWPVLVSVCLCDLFPLPFYPLELEQST